MVSDKSDLKAADRTGFHPKRFWKIVSVEENQSGFGVCLDGRPVKTPVGNALILPNPALAEHIAAEWQAVEGTLSFANLPLTRLGFAACDMDAERRGRGVEAFLKYATTEHLIFLSPYPKALQDKEREIWGEWLDWAKQSHGLHFHQTTALTPPPFEPENEARLLALYDGISDFDRAGLGLAIPILNSVVLGLALKAGALTGEAAFDVSRIGEKFQASTWGEDAEHTIGLAAQGRDLNAVTLWFNSLRP